MFSISIYLFCAIASFFSGRRFFHVWKEGGQASHREFGLFFYVIGASFIAGALTALTGFAGGVMQELADALVLISFGFALRACIRFQQLHVSFRIVNVVIFTAVAARLFIGLAALPDPILKDGIIYPYYSETSSVIQGALVVIFTFLIATVLLSNIKNIRSKKWRVLFLGAAFMLGGVGGALMGANDFTTIVAGTSMLFVCFVMMWLSVSRSSRQEKNRGSQA